MPKFYTFPHYEINVKDESIGNPLVVENLALHRPIFFSFAEKGKPGVPVYGSFEELVGTFGEGTFDVYSKFYKHPTLFLEKCLQHNKAFFVRLADDAAEAATLVLECSAYNVDVVQYQKDGTTGFRLVDGNGDPIPVDDGSGGSLAEPGIAIKWSVRALGAGENPKTITPTTTTIPDPFGGADLDVTTYPILVMTATSPGAWANTDGFKLFWDPTSDAGVAASMESMIFNITPVQTLWGADTPSDVRNRFLQTSTEFTFKEGTVDTNTMRRYNLDEVLVNDYAEGDLPFDVVSYPANVQTIGERCLLVELPGVNANFDEIDGKPYMVNLVTCASTSQHLYDHIQLDESAGSVLLDSNVIQYMTGGADGLTNNATLEELTQAWLDVEGAAVFPEIMDQAHYPITHLYDSGYSIDTKTAMIDFLSIRDDVKVILSTQAVYQKGADFTAPELAAWEVKQAPNTKAEDLSTGGYLRSRALLHPESLIYGTQACRVTILQQCGKLNEVTSYTDIVPATLDCMVKKGIWQGATYMKGKPKGLPHSAVTVLKDINWFPVQADFKQLSWDTNLNYMQYYDMTSVHYPDVISVYQYMTSLLSDDIFTDMLIYVKHITHYQWAKFAGVDDPINELIGDIKTSLGKAIYDALGNHLRAEVNPYQTELDAELGYALTIEIPVYSTVSNRVWNVIVPVRRESVV